MNTITIEQAIEQHRKLFATWDALSDEASKDEWDAVSAALDAAYDALAELAEIPCKSEEEFRAKIKYLFNAYRSVWGEDWQTGDPSAIMEAIKLHFAI